MEINRLGSMLFLELFSGSQGSIELRDALGDFYPCVDLCSAEFRAEYLKVLRNMVCTL